MVELKICGLTRRADAEAAVRCGARYVGAVFATQSPRAVDATRAAALFAGLDARRVGVFVDSPVTEIAAAAATAGLDVVQLHGEERADEIRALREAGDWRIWKAARLRAASELRELVDRYGEHVDGLLLDAWHPERHGGTGRRFAWAAAAELRDLVPAGVMLIIAGGLRPENVGRAVALLRPDAVDISSGVEIAPGAKDPARIEAVMDALRASPR